MSKRKETKRVGLKDIAESVGVSVSTASMALADHPDINGETKRRVRASSRQLGYRKPARKTAPPANKPDVLAGLRFGFVLVGRRLDHESHLGVLHTFVTRADAYCRGLEVQAIEHTDDAPQAIDQLLGYARQVDGVILTGLVTREMVTELEMLGMPHVVLGQSMAQLGDVNTRMGRVVRPDAIGMGEAATRALLNAGHQRIGFIAEQAPSGYWIDEWRRGQHIALLDAGITPEPHWTHLAGEFAVGGVPAAEAMAKLKPAERPTGYIVPDIGTAASFVQHLRAVAGVDLSPDCLVTATFDFMLERYGMTHYPHVGCAVGDLVEMSLRELRQICESPLPCATDVVVPYRCYNMPAPVEAQ